MRIEILKESISLAETLNFTETAKRFFITQPVLSKHIAALEHEAGFPIFLRDRHSVCLTEKGRLFIEEARKAAAAYDAFVEGVGRIRESSTDILRVGYLLGASKPFIRDACSAFERENPGTLLYFFAMENSDIPAALAEDRVDIAIATSTAEYPRSVYATEPLFEDRFCVAMLKGHALAGRKVVEPADLGGTRVIFPSSSSAPAESGRIGRLLASVAQKADCSDSFFDMNSIPVILAQGDCVVVTMHHLRHYFSEDDIVFLPFSDSVPPFDVMLVWKRTQESDAILAFRDAVKASVAANIAQIVA